MKCLPASPKTTEIISNLFDQGIDLSGETRNLNPHARLVLNDFFLKRGGGGGIYEE